MIKRVSIIAIGIVMCGLQALMGQAITFHSPVSWITLRESAVKTKALIDTAEVKKNSISLTLSKVVKGKKIKLAKTSLKPKDYSFEKDLAELKETVLGGEDYLMVDWAVKGTDKKGFIRPFGIVKLENNGIANPTACKQVSQEMNLAALAEVVKDEDFIAVGSGKMCPLWSEKALGLVLKDVKDLEEISFCIDGKNGKNAFLAFSDRELVYYPKKDSLATIYYDRSFTDKNIAYEANDWKNEVTVTKEGEQCLIVIPWHDLAIKPTKDRIIGFAAFADAAMPKTAQKKIPGTWGNITLK